MTRRYLVAVPTVLAGLVLCGCSSEAEGSGPAATQYEAVSPADVGYKPSDPGGIGAGLKIGTVTTRNQEEAAVSSAWTTYWKTRLQAWNQRNAVLPAIKTVATGTARQDIVDGVGTLKQNDTFMVGLMKVGVTQVDVTGDEALLRGCVNDSLRVVDLNGEAVNNPSSASKVRVAQIVRSGSQWVVVKDDLASSSTSTCDTGI